MKAGKSCGFVQLTPEAGDTASLRDCVITLFEAYREGGQLNNLRINGREVNNLSWNEFKHHTAMDIFALDRTDYLETKGMRDFFVTLQTRPYILWKCYAVAGYFDEDGSPEQYLVCARHTIWE